MISHTNQKLFFNPWNNFLIFLVFFLLRFLTVPSFWWFSSSQYPLILIILLIWLINNSLYFPILILSIHWLSHISATQRSLIHTSFDTLTFWILYNSIFSPILNTMLFSVSIFSLILLIYQSLTLPNSDTVSFWIQILANLQFLELPHFDTLNLYILILSTFQPLMLFSLINQVGWGRGSRIHRLHLCRRVRPPLQRLS